MAAAWLEIFVKHNSRVCLSDSDMSSLSTTAISAERSERLQQFCKDLWDYRELFWTFVQRDIKVRYKQTALGVIWVVLQPLFVMGAFSLIFGKIARMPTE